FLENKILLSYNSSKDYKTGPSGNRSITPLFGLLGGKDYSSEWVSGILSCTTTLSDVSYSWMNGSVTTNNWTPMNETASFAFVSAMDSTDSEYARLQLGIETSFTAASKTEDIASGWASAYDQTFLSVVYGILTQRPPISIIQSSTTLMTRIPRAPFITLIVLDLIYATIGTCLMIAALIAIRSGRSVRDAQARLSTLAVVAESFESPAWGDDAKNVDMLFAERRGEPTRRIALVRRAGGGRKFKQIVVPKNYVRSIIPPPASNSRRTASSNPCNTSSLVAGSRLQGRRTPSSSTLPTTATAISPSQPTNATENPSARHKQTEGSKSARNARNS
ncbi:MAG: hypothetical protein LQ338_000153, partial [Usnochroma carphineum]